MHKRFVFVMTTVFFLVVAGSALAEESPDIQIPAGTQCIISYDGYLQMMDNPPVKLIMADTLIVVTNSHPTLGMIASIEVFDKYGESLGRHPLLNGGQPLSLIPPNGYGWITLSQIVNRSTKDPYGNPLAEKLSFRIYTDKPGRIISPVVEIKQVVYEFEVRMDVEGPNPIWDPSLFKMWTETSLGGKYGTGIVWTAF